MNDSTEVLSLDELMDLAAEPRSAPTQPLAAPAALSYPAEPTVHLTRPAAGPPAPQPRPQKAERESTEPGQWAVLATRMRTDGRRMLTDAQRASATGVTHARKWLETNDNALIAATVLVTLLLLIIIGAL